MKLLVIGHPLIIDANRKFWNVYAQTSQALVDVLMPSRWSSNLNKDISYQFNSDTDAQFRNLFPSTAFIKGNGSFYFYNPFQVLKVMWHDKYDAIYLNQETWAMSTLLVLICKLLSPNAKTPVYLYVQQNLKKMKLRFLHPYERFISRFIHAFLYCSEGVKDVLRWKKITTPCVYFPLAFDEDSYRVKSLASSSTDFRIGYLGRISEEKGMRVLLKACGELKKVNFPFKLVLGGNGPLVAEMKTYDFVEYVGLIPHSQAHTFYEKIDCFILPSQTWPNWKEQFGRVIVESLAAGVPILGSSSGSIPEVMGKADWNWVFEESSHLEIAQKISDLKDFLQTEAGQKSLAHSIQKNHEIFSMRSVAKNIDHTFRTQSP